MEGLDEEEDKVTTNLKANNDFAQRKRDTQRCRPPRLQSFEQEDEQLKRRVYASTSTLRQAQVGERLFSNPEKSFNGKHQKVASPWYATHTPMAESDGASSMFVTSQLKQYHSSRGRPGFHRHYHQSLPSRELGAEIYNVHQTTNSTTKDKKGSVTYSKNSFQGRMGNGGSKLKYPPGHSSKREFQKSGYMYSARTEADTQRLPTSKRNTRQVYGQTAKYSGQKTMTKENSSQSYAVKDRSWIVKSFRFDSLLELATKAPNEIVCSLHSNLKGFLRTLEQEQKPSVYDCVMLLLFKVAECLQDTGEAKPMASLILAEILSPRCTHFQLCLKLYVTRDILHCKSCTCELLGSRKPAVHDFQECRVRSLYKFFRRVLEIIPSIAWRILPIDEFIQSVKRTRLSLDLELLSEVEVLKQLQIESRDLYNPPTFSEVSSPCAQLTWDNSEYRELPIFPEWQELCTPDSPAKLRANIINGRYTDWMHYYDIQFRLLREDFTAPLRRGIYEYIQGNRGRQLRDIRVYRDAVLIEPLTSHEGICFKVKFDNSHLKYCKWEHSKKLLFGSLLCFSPDGFKETVLFATVINRDPKELNEGCIDVQFQGGIPMLAFYLKKQMFTIVESSAYFEASRHIMTSLQNAETETMPFTNYLINNQCDSVAAPHYLQQRGNNAYDLKCMYPENTHKQTVHCILSTSSSAHDLEARALVVDELEETVGHVNSLSQVAECKYAQWPHEEDTMLDHSQLEAMRMALTQEIAVIQGPPGTGKTFIGIKIVQALLSNRKQWDPYKNSPILVMCLTNHALDQFLEGILPIKPPETARFAGQFEDCPKLIRIGSRSKSERISEFNIANVSRSVSLPRHIVTEKEESRSVVRRQQLKVKESLTNLARDQSRFLTFTDLERVITTDNPNHHYQLHSMAESPAEQKKTLEIWLGLWELYSEQLNAKSISLVNQTRNKKFKTKAVHVSSRSQEQYKPKTKHDGLPMNLDKHKSFYANDEAKNDNVEESFTEDFGDELLHVEGEATLENEARMLDVDDDNCLQPIIKTAIETPQIKDRDARNEHSKSQTASDNLSVTNADMLSPGQTSPKPKHDDTYTMEESTTEESEDEIPDEGGEGDCKVQYLEPVLNTRTKIRRQITAKNVSDKWVQRKTSNMIRISRHLRQRKDHDNILKRGLMKGRFTEKQVEQIRDVTNLEGEDRWKLYNYWRAKHLEFKEDQCEVNCTDYNESCKRQRAAKHNADRFTLETADIIGMTTTGAAKYQHVLHMVKPRIVIVEEAAEVLESHIVSALNAGTQHLILIGDHKQLKPKPNEYRLVTQYNMDISLFERLIRNNFPHATLNIQHRMRPEIANLVRPHIYTSLVDHESVLQYGDVRGVKNNLFFIQHEHNETHDENLLSHSNPHEAAFLTALCKYFLQQGYKPEQITILVTYTGQLLHFRSLMPRDIFEGVLVRTVDNYQGEENDLILLSLVRSNKERNVGFLKEDNRICVALSRAKAGFYCIGNFNMLREKSLLWENIIQDLAAKQLIGEALQLCCKNHPSNTFSVRMPKDFGTKAPEGGCLLNCDFRLACGHVCTKKCHSLNSDHIQYKCTKPCSRACPEGHVCQRPCYRSCGECMVKITKTLPTCGHYKSMECYRSPKTVPCEKPCERLCSSGHVCQMLCYKECKCIFEVPKQIPKCGHTQMVPCYQEPSSFHCTENCEKKCEQGHPCPRKCFLPCGPCKVKVEKVPQKCNHKHLISCHIQSSNYYCDMPCEKTLKCGHPCTLKCAQDCDLCSCSYILTKKLGCGHDIDIPCHEKSRPFPLCHIEIKRTLECGHDIEIPCHDKLQLFPLCHIKIKRTLECGHDIEIPCHDKSRPFPLCHIKIKRTLECGHDIEIPCHDKSRLFPLCHIKIRKTIDCGHEIDIPCYKSKLPDITKLCHKQCNKVMPCTHSCTKLCCESCTDKCMVTVRKKWPCGHKLKRSCYRTQNPELFPCKRKCKRELGCGHTCAKSCGQSCECNAEVEKVLPCGHEYVLSCQTKPTEVKCDAFCKFKLACGHRCGGICGECATKRCHLPCKYNMELQRFCGHKSVVRCVDLNDVHSGKQKQCLTQCIHRACPDECTSECRPCGQPCPWNCPHFTCTKLCHEICDRPRCNKPCCARLKCGHPCVGVCGEPCLSVCPICQTKKFNKQLPEGTGYKQDEQYIQLMCGHIYVMKYLDQYTSDMTCDNTMILPISCPKCKTPLTANHRYGNVCKWRYLDKQAVQEKIRTLTLKHSVTIEQASKLENRLATTTAMSFEKVDSYLLTLHERKSRMKDGWLFDDNEHLCLFQPLPHQTKRIMKLQDDLSPDKVANIGPQENFLNTVLINAIEHFCAYTEIAESIHKPMLPCSIDIKVHLSTYTVMLLELLDKTSRLSVQLVHDITSEMYHLSLIVQLFSMENTIHLESSIPSAIPPMIETSLEMFLKSLEKNHTHRVTKEDYIKYSKNLKEIYVGNSGVRMPIEYEVVAKDIHESTPPILKGYWRKCIRGHYYCSPLTISKDILVPCHDCLRQ